MTAATAGPATAPELHHAAEWTAIGTTVRVVVAEPELLGEARLILERELAELDAAASRFRPDSEVRQLQSAGRPVRISALLTELIDVALDAARDTDGDVDPTLGVPLVDLGYDRDLPLITRPARVRFIRHAPGWQRVQLDREHQIVTVPTGTLIDLGATAKAWAADRCARLVAGLGTGTLVSLGGDIATAGADPAGGWCVTVQDRPDRPDEGQVTRIALREGTALATSSTISRTWRQGRLAMHHVLDPRTCRPVTPVWRTVSVAAGDCVQANVASTAALVRGHAAPAWLVRVGLPARLVSTAGEVTTLGSWPAP